MSVKVPAAFDFSNHIWVQASLNWARSLPLGHTRSSSPGWMLRQQ